MVFMVVLLVSAAAAAWVYADARNLRVYPGVALRSALFVLFFLPAGLPWWLLERRKMVRADRGQV